MLSKLEGTEMQPAFEEELALVNKLTRIITLSLNIEEVYESFVDELRQYMSVDWASLVPIEQDKLRFRALSSKIGSFWASGDLTSRKALARWDLLKDRTFEPLA